VALVIAFLVLSLGVHEAAHAWMAWKRGDSTAKDLGRMTLNPIAHVDPVMTIALPAIVYLLSGFVFGGARPVPVNPTRLRSPLRDMSLVALAGPASNVLLAILFLAVYKVFVYTGLYVGAADSLRGREDQLLPLVLGASVMFNVLLAVFNLLPIPPLDGSRVMAWILPAQLRESYVGLERMGMFLIFALIFFFPPFQRLLFGAMSSLYQMVDWLTFPIDELLARPRGS
jgi:Zn-dependent protease